MVAPVSTPPQPAPTYSPLKKDAREEAADTFTGFNGSDLSLQEYVDYDPAVRARLSKVEAIRKQMQTDKAKARDLLALDTAVTNFKSLAEGISGPTDTRDNAFRRHVSSATSSGETFPGSTYVDIDTTPDAIPGSYDIKVNKLAKEHSVKIGTKTLLGVGDPAEHVSDLKIVFNKVMGALGEAPPIDDINTLRDEILSLDIDKDAAGLPSNIYAKVIFSIINDIATSDDPDIDSTVSNAQNLAAIKYAEILGGESSSLKDMKEVYYKISNFAGSVTQLKDAIEAMTTISIDEDGTPRDPRAKALYDLCIDEINRAAAAAPVEVPSLQTVKDAADAYFTQEKDAIIAFVEQNSKFITSGFRDTSDIAVGDDKPLRAGSYFLFSGPGEDLTATTVYKDLLYAYKIIEAIEAMDDDDLDVNTLNSLIYDPFNAGDSIITTNGDMDSGDQGLPSTQFPLARDIVEKLREAIAANGGNISADDALDNGDVQTSINPANISAKINEIFDRDAIGSLARDENKFTTAIKKAFVQASTKAGADLESIATAIADDNGGEYFSFVRSCSIKLDDGARLTDVISAINLTTTNSGVAASSSAISSGMKLLEITSTNTGTEYSFNIKKFTAPAPDEGFDEAVNIPLSNPDDAERLIIPELSEVIASTDAEVEVNGHLGFYQTNKPTISEGTTLHLKSVNSKDGSVRVEVARDVALAADQLNLFVVTFNQLSETIAKLTERNEEGVHTEEATLVGSASARSVQEMVNAAFSHYSDAGLSLKSLGLSISDLPSPDREGKMFKGIIFDRQIFEQKAREVPEDVVKFFERSVTSSDSRLRLVSTGSSFTANQASFKVTIDTNNPYPGPDDDTNLGVQIQMLDASGEVIAGSEEYHTLEGTPGDYKIYVRDKSSKFYGMAFAYNGPANDPGTPSSIDMKIENGYGAKLFATANSLASGLGQIGKIMSEAQRITDSQSILKFEETNAFQSLESVKEVAYRRAARHIQLAELAKKATEIMEMWMKLLTADK